VRAVVIKGSGKGFCAGGDVKEMFEATDKSSFLRSLSKGIQRCIIEIRTMQKPVIAAVNGAALGAGLSLVMACDLVIAVEGVKFNSAFITIGLAPGCGTHFVTRLFGYQRACELVLTAKTFTAEEAFKMGFVNKVVKEEVLNEAIDEYVSKFRKLPPLAVGMAKMLLNESMHNDLLTHHELESKTASLSAASEDFKEGVRAFVEKRKAVFRGI
jgi:2-(1,2-epoxy-1,2-dihydrophenyl)acetyl-CoA isomerase